MTNYIENVEQVAMDAVFRRGTLWESLRSSWRTYEHLAREVGYDVLEHAAREQNGLLRRCVRELLTTLYAVPGAESPARDAAMLIKKDQEYGGSWCRRGGPGAFMMLARKWDRIEHQVAKSGEDLSAALFIDRREEGIQDDLGDLRRYLILVEAWCLERAQELADAADAVAAPSDEPAKATEREEDIPF